MPHDKPFKLGRLFFKYIAGTPLEKQGWTGERLGAALEARGFIKIVELQGYNSKGQWTEKVTRYFEVPGMALNNRIIEEVTK